MNPAISSINDIEFSGRLSSALNQQSQQQFSLLLAMLEQNYLDRLHIHDDAEAASAAFDPASSGLSCYPVTPLKAEARDWQQLGQINSMLGDKRPGDARLYQIMHPGPLSLRNDSMHIDEDVINNSPLSAQQKLRKPDNTDKQLEVDETGLYEILNQIHASEQAA
ncbi:VC2046/SO_2500 family protein [Neptunicella sp. SCSIO 80796]|uniref:VC2046/SO_2500 family protein n=1 Tax=Neptunicella plasticusilytica TaxID=3117012 RepID=UPI003A4D48FD